MKKRIFVLGVIVMLCLVVTGGMFGIDRYRMHENKPVIFSTWGYPYAPPVISEEPEGVSQSLTEPPVLGLKDKEGIVQATCLTSTNDWSYGNQTMMSDYPSHNNREYAEENVLKTGETEAVYQEYFIDNTYGKIVRTRWFRLDPYDMMKTHIPYTDSSVCVPESNGKEHILEITVEYPQGTVVYCVKVS
ncbi:MAG: hypothetical protein J6K51_06240 [Clostridia bacterium]|nr:hypothetical protein [Clostridia bacterium]